MKTLIEMAREAGAELAELPMADAIVFGVDDLEWNSAAFQRFALLVRADERSECACRAGIALLGADRGLANRVDQAIRARSKT